MNTKDKALLECIQSNWGGVGGFSKGNSNTMQYRVGSLSQLIQTVIPHFNKYPLLTKKRADFLLFKSAVEMINRKEHLTPEGLQKIVNIKASMNNGLSDQLKNALSSTPVTRPVFEVTGISDANWISGFTDAEGCFNIHIHRSRTHRLGAQVLIRFQITQHTRDLELMLRIKGYLGCGNIEPHPQRSTASLVVTKFSDIIDKIIPLFEKYPLHGAKAKDYEDFKKVAEIMKENGHLTHSGLEQILKLKAGMNIGRLGKPL